MADSYLYNDVLRTGKVVYREPGCRIVCDGHNHYGVTDLDMRPIHSCICSGKPETPPTQPVARPRFEIYNKDADFFWDHKYGVMFWLRLSGGIRDNYSLVQPDTYVADIVALLNRQDHADILLQSEQGTTG